MRLFDAYIMVDWSGGDRRRAGKNDCLWIAHGRHLEAAPTTESPRSRTEATQTLRSLLIELSVRENKRVLICADFAYGYPRGFSSILPTTDTRPWLNVWNFLTTHLADDLKTRAGAKPSNNSNRFVVANTINGMAGGRSPGPFWCLFEPGSQPHIPQRRPAQPYASRSCSISADRITDTRASSDTAFRLFGTGSVGSQAITGIPRVAALRSDPALAPISAVWPFETGWLENDATPSWRVLHAEIYPSIRAPLEDSVKDRGQVRAMWHWVRDLDAAEQLASELARPSGIVEGSAEDLAIRTEEGWILGCPR